MKTKIINISKFFTFDDNSNDLSVVKDHEILIQDGKIIEISKNCGDCEDIINANNCIITPGFIDSHTHPIFIGNRSNEFLMKISGKTYNQISKEGGGIFSSVKMLRKSSDDELHEASLNNIKPFIYNGTTTIEAKSGYGLTTKDEVRSLKIIKKINNELPIDILPTFLGAHAVPPEYSKVDYINIICNEMIPEISNNKLAVFCDVFCEDGYFNKDECFKILDTAKSYGMIPRLHADEFVYSDGSILAKEIEAASADHLMAINDEGINALSSSNVIATLLPGTTFTLNKSNYANGRKLIDNGCNVALATDFNPGTCTIRSLTQIMLLSILYCGMNLEESFKAVTLNGAKSLMKGNELGVIKKNYQADLLFWDIDVLDEIVYWNDANIVKLKHVMKKGKIIN